MLSHATHPRSAWAAALPCDAAGTADPLRRPLQDARSPAQGYSYGLCSHGLYIVMAYIVMALQDARSPAQGYSYGLCSYGLYSYDPSAQ